MKKNLLITARLVLVSALVLMALSCGASHRLKEYTFKGLTVAALISAPQPQVFADSFLEIDTENLVATALRIGTTIAKDATADEAQERLNAAMEEVNVPEIIRHGTLNRCSQYLQLRPVEDSGEADFLLDLYVHYYGIDAESWDAGVYFEIKMDVALLDNNTGQEIWKTCVDERQPVTRGLFLLGSLAADNVFSAIALSQISEEEMAVGFQHLSEDTAEKVIRRLRRDYHESRRETTES
jgi:hypothetical protein